MDDLTGAIVGDRYTVERAIGRGGMATVWIATDARLARVLAIKTLHPDLAGAIGADRFLREVRLTAGLQHPSIVPILDSGVFERPDGTGVLWYAMPYLEGESLRVRLDRERQLPIDEALRVVEAVGEALVIAHRQQVIHRDIKPENVILAGDRVYVVDFGIAKAVGATESDRLTSTGLAIGTPAYMSPEQSVGEAVDARSDQYALATILYEMIAGDPPFAGSNTQALFARRLAEPARSLATVRSTVPAAVERATLRALERAPADRFATVAEFLAALRAPAAPALAPDRRRARARWLVLAGGLAAAGVAGWSLRSRDPVAPARATAELDVETMYRRGVRAYDRRTPAGVIDAIGAQRAAIERDSTYAPAWNALAKAYVRAHQRGFRVPATASERLLSLAADAVEQALAVDSLSADTWMTRAIVSHQVDPEDLDPALRAIRRSIAIDSTQAPAWHFLALYLAEKRDLDRALEAWRRSVRLNPSYAQGLTFLALGHYWRRSFDSAAAWADSALRIDPNYLLARSTAGFAAVERGDVVRAAAAFEAALRLSTDIELANSLAGLALVKARSGRRADAVLLLRRADSLAATYERVPLHTSVFVAQGHAAVGQIDRALSALRYEPTRDAHFQLHLRCDPPFAPLANEPRFRALLVVARPAPGASC